MRCLKRNKRSFYVCKYLGKTELVDELGYSTGEYVLNYDSPKKYRGNISNARGDSQIEVFGSLEQYDRVIVLDEIDAIGVNDVLFIDTEILFDEWNNPLNDYVVTFAPKGSQAIAISKVS